MRFIVWFSHTGTRICYASFECILDHESPRPVEVPAIFLTRLASEDSPAMRLEAEAEGACGYGSSTIND